MKITSALGLVFFLGLITLPPAAAIDFEQEITPERVPGLIEALKNRNTRKLAATTLVMIGEPSVEPVAKLLTDENPLLRGTAATVLGRLGPVAGKAAPNLVQALGQDAYRELYVQALVRIGRPAVGPLVDAFKSDDLQVHVDVARVLSHLGSDASAAVPTLVQALQIRDERLWDARVSQAVAENYRSSMAEALGKIGQPAAPALIALLEDPKTNSLARTWAIKALVELGPAAKDAISPLTKIVRRQDAGDGSVAVEALGAIGPQAASAVPAMVDFFKTRVNLPATADALAEMGPVAVAPLIEQLTDENALLVEWASKALTKIGLPAVDPLCTEVMTGGTKQRQAAAEVLAEMGQPAVPGLVGVVERGDREARLLGVAALSQIGAHARSAVPVLIHAVKDNDRQVRLATAEALARIGTTNRIALDALIEALDDKNLNVRVAAAQTLGGMGPVSKDAVPAMMDALHATDVPAEVRLQYMMLIASGMARIGDPAAPALVQAFLDEDPLMRDVAVEMLAEMARTSELVNNVLPQLLAHPTAQVRKHALLALQRRYPGGGIFVAVGKPAVLPLVESLEFGNDEVRNDAIRALAKLGEPAVPALCEAVRVENPTVRLAAAQALRGVGPPAKDAVGPLFEALRAVLAAMPQSQSQDEADVTSIHFQHVFISALANMGEASVTGLSEGLQDQDPRVRLLCAQTLERMGPSAKEGVPALVTALADPDMKVCAGAAKALAAVGPDAEPAIAALIEVFHVDDAVVRQAELPTFLWTDALMAAAETLVNIGQPSVEPLVSTLNDPDPRVRRYAAWALRRITIDTAKLAEIGDKTVPIAAKALQDENAIVRAAAAMILNQLGAEAAPAKDALAAVVGDEDERVRKYAVWALARIDPQNEALLGLGRSDVPLLMAAFKEDDEALRDNMAIVLGRIGEPALKDLNVALRDGNLEMRRAAIKAVGRIGPAAEPLLPEITRAIRNEDPELHKHAAAALSQVIVEPWKLARIGQPAVPALIETLHDKDPKLRQTAIEALKTIGEGALPQLVKALNDPSDDVRRAAANILGEAGPNARFVLPEIVAVFDGEDYRAQIAAARALAGIGPQAAAAVDPLIKALKIDEEKLTSKDLPPQVWQSYRREMAGALAKIGEPALDASFALLSEENSKIRDWGAIILSQMGPNSRKVVDKLVAGLKDKNPRVRNHSLWALRQFAPREAARALTRP